MNLLMVLLFWIRIFIIFDFFCFLLFEFLVWLNFGVGFFLVIICVWLFVLLVRGWLLVLYLWVLNLIELMLVFMRVFDFLVKRRFEFLILWGILVWRIRRGFRLVRVWIVFLVCLRIGGIYLMSGEYFLKYVWRNVDFLIRYFGGVY